MKRVALLIAAGALILAAAACGWPTTVLPTAAPPTAVPPTQAPPTQPSPGIAELMLKNDSGITVCAVYISTTESDSWGDNRLTGSEAIQSGSSRNFQVPEGSYDVRADDCDGNPVSEEVQGQQISGEMTWTISP